jgi:hypothetical protein
MQKEISSMHAKVQNTAVSKPPRLEERTGPKNQLSMIDRDD